MQTNTFQIVLATDEVYTYAIFNYVDINWSSHTEAGGDTVKGEGGISAYVRVFSNNHQYKIKYYDSINHLFTFLSQKHIHRLDLMLEMVHVRLSINRTVNQNYYILSLKMVGLMAFLDVIFFVSMKKLLLVHVGI